MNRDGQTRSIWQDAGAPDYAPQNIWHQENVYDVVVIGGGITGVTTALRLQEGGVKCILAEAPNLGYGTTRGTTEEKCMGSIRFVRMPGVL